MYIDVLFQSTSFLFSLLDSLLQEFMIILRFPSCFLMTSSFSSGQSRQHPVLPWWRSVSNTGSIYLCTCAIVREFVFICQVCCINGIWGALIINTGWCCQQKNTLVPNTHKHAFQIHIVHEMSFYLNNRHVNQQLFTQSLQALLCSSLALL